MNIVLIGMRGVGKTNVARRLGFRMKRPVMSTDVLIEYEHGVTIPAFVAAHGWPAFRDAEFEVLTKVCRMDGLIIDAGGGVVVDLAPDGSEVFSERKVGLLRGTGEVIFLRGDLHRLADKVAGDPSRPVLDARHTALELMQARLPFYQAAAHREIDVEGRHRKEIAKEIAASHS